MYRKVKRLKVVSRLPVQEMEILKANKKIINKKYRI